MVRIKMVFFVLIFFSLTGCKTLGNSNSSNHMVPSTSNSECAELTKEDPWGQTVEAICGLLGSFCDTVKVKIQVPHPAEIDLAKYRQVAFANIGGNYGEAFSASLKEQMVRDGRLKVIDRSQLNALLKELELSDSDLVDPTNRAKLGNLLPATALVMGNVNKEYKESKSSENSSCAIMQNGKMTTKPCMKIIRTGTANMQGEISVAEVETGAQIQAKHLHSSMEEKTETTTGDPAPVNEGLLHERNLNQIVAAMTKATLAWVENRKVVFYKDSNLPTLERGIKEAQAGELEAAKNIFSKTIEDNKGNTAISQNALAAAYFDLGVTYAYSQSYDQAEEAFKTVDDLAINEFPADTMRKIVKCLRDEKNKMDQQMASK